MVYEFPVELLRDAGVAQGAPPFAVVSSNYNDLSVGKCVPCQPPLTHVCGLMTTASMIQSKRLT